MRAGPSDNDYQFQLKVVIVKKLLTIFATKDKKLILKKLVNKKGFKKPLLTWYLIIQVFIIFKNQYKPIQQKNLNHKLTYFNLLKYSIFCLISP